MKKYIYHTKKIIFMVEFLSVIIILLFTFNNRLDSSFSVIFLEILGFTWCILPKLSHSTFF